MKCGSSWFRTFQDNPVAIDPEDNNNSFLMSQAQFVSSVIQAISGVQVGGSSLRGCEPWPTDQPFLPATLLLSKAGFGPNLDLTLYYDSYDFQIPKHHQTSAVGMARNPSFMGKAGAVKPAITNSRASSCQMLFCIRNEHWEDLARSSVVLCTSQLTCHPHVVSENRLYIWIYPQNPQN